MHFIRSRRFVYLPQVPQPSATYLLVPAFKSNNGREEKLDVDTESSHSSDGSARERVISNLDAKLTIIKGQLNRPSFTPPPK